MKGDDTTTEATATATKEAAPGSPCVVAVGASAGALEALRALFGAMPADSGAAFIVAVHRAPRRGSRLAELLQPYTRLPVRESDGTIALEPNTIVVIPATAEVGSIDARLHVVATKDRTPRASQIDPVFRALAGAYLSRCVGVLLTGAGSDGALGLGQIKDKGGLTIVQEPAEAEYASMPRSAIATGVADLVLPLRDIPAFIARFCGSASESLAARPEWAESSRPLRALLDVLGDRTGRDFSVFRRALLVRRVGKRMRLHAVNDLGTYVDLLRADSGEADALAGDLQQHVTEFFRHDAVFERLEKDVLPRLFDLKAGDSESLRAWVVGCSTGEEAYSLGIALLEQRQLQDSQPQLQVFASDMAEESLQRARLGYYPLEIEDAISSERLAYFFMRDDDRGYRVRAQLRNIIVFAHHDVVRDFPFSRLDLIVCRRALLEDLKPEVRQAVLRNFHYALRPHGMLVIDAGERFELDDRPKLFERDGDGGLFRRVAVAGKLADLPRAAYAMPVGDSAEFESAGRVQDVRLVHLAMLERYAPASVLVDADDRVVHYSARAGRYVRLPGGELTHELVHLLREPLRSAVRGGLEAVDRGSAAWSSDTLLVHANDGIRRVIVRVEAVEPSPAAANVKLVIFEERGVGDRTPAADAAVAASDFTAVLETALEGASRRLRSVVEQGRLDDARQDAAGAAAYDGALAPILDDLEAAKEELQSVNEELLSLDQDNRARVDELASMSADLEVLLESTGLATLFLDRDLRIVRFTPPLLELFHMLPGDKGRPLAELRHRLREHDLLRDARRVLKHLSPLEREVEADNGKWYLMRMLPYRSEPQGLDGVAITLVDITSRKKAELSLREADRRKDEFIALLAHELRNPLAPISSGIEILKRRDVDPAIAERVTLTMSRQAAQLVRLIDDLLDVSRINSGRLHLRKGAVALGDVVRDAVAAVRPLIDRSGHELKVELPQERVMLDADAARLTQVLANLLNNSARYTPSGGRIEVRARREGGSAVVTVKDNGYGIADNALPHVFEMFYQGADPRSATQTGLGIGLALARSLVDMHGGTISAASAGVDRGSEFTLRLPVRDHVAAEPSVPAPANANSDCGGHRVLVVDDNADAAKTLAVLIQTLGENDVHVALSGEEALPLAKRVRPDTVFLDLKMPNMDGYEVAQRLRSEPWGEGAWLVALTGWGLDEHKRRTRDAGFDQHLTKPADRAALEAILSRPPNGRAERNLAADH